MNALPWASLPSLGEFFSSLLLGYALIPVVPTWYLVGGGKEKKGLRKAEPLSHEGAEHLGLLKLGQHPFPTHLLFL